MTNDERRTIINALLLGAFFFLASCAAPTPSIVLPTFAAPTPSATARQPIPETAILNSCCTPSPTHSSSEIPTLFLPLSPSPSLFPSPSLIPSRTPSPSFAPSPTPSPSPSSALASPSSQAIPHLEVLAANLAEPDDLVLAPDGSIYFSDVGDRTVKRLDRAGKVTTILSDLEEPEGLVFLPDGTLVVAEQGKNRLLRLDLATKQLTTFLELQNRTGRPGVDGIIFDSHTQTIIVPDSPNGTLLRVSLDGKILETIARGFIRPTGADIEPDGSILVAEENGNAITRVRPNGAKQIVARVPVPDDVIVDTNGNIYANTLGNGAIHHIDARTRADRILWKGLSNPQGIIFDTDGNLIVTDPGNHRIIKILIR